jgi:integrase
MIKVNFNLRDRSQQNKLSPININIRWNRQRLVIPSGERVEPRYWLDSQEVSKRVIGSADINMRLSNQKTALEKMYRSFLELKEFDPSPAQFKEFIESSQTSKKNNPSSLVQFCSEFIVRSSERVNSTSGVRLAQTTLKKYKTTLQHLIDFEKKKKRVLEFSSIDLLFYDELISYLTTVKGLAVNSVGKYVQTLKTFIRAAEEEGIVVNQSYRSRRFRTPSEQTDKVYLTEGELNEMMNLDLSNDSRLERVRDLFIVGACTGLRFGDFSKLQPEQFDGDCLKIRTAKTGKVVVIPLDSRVREIRAKYSGHSANSLPPAVSNQKMNAYLKEVAARVPSLQGVVILSSTVGGARKNATKKKFEFVTTHTARRSFATNLYSKGCPTRSIMAITGHQTESAFRAYIRLNNEEHADIVQHFMNQNVKLKIVS